MPSKCENVISLKQYGPTCWFNAILMAVLYSEGSRKLLLEKSESWDKTIKVFRTLAFILKNKYLRTDNISQDYAYFDKVRPEHILKQLHQYNRKKFHELKIFRYGYYSSLYIRKIYKLLGAKVLFLDLVNDKLFYSRHNNVTRIDTSASFIIQDKPILTILKHFEDPDVIIIRMLSQGDDIDFTPYPLHYDLYYLLDNNYITEKTYNSLFRLGKNITYKDDTYTQDSVLLTNWNNMHLKKGHSITGITCEKERYVYNGWTRTTIDPNMKKTSEDIEDIEIPCEIMKFDWDIHKNTNFCLNLQKCILDTMKIDVKDLCFSFNKGRREIIYIKNTKPEGSALTYIQELEATKLAKTAKPAKPAKPSKPAKPAKICPEGKVINPLTGRCVLLKNLNKLPKTRLSYPEKECSEGKVLNPKTGKCIKIKPVKPVKSVKPVKPVKPPKVCPEGKMINPKTGRCIKIRVQK